MSFFPGQDPVPGDHQSIDAIETLIIPRTSEVGGLQVRRALPTAKRRLVGPFIFFDRMGPALLRAGQALDVAPHPHIGLSTVTYLLDGNIRHRDSLGTEQVINPGEVNLMTAGRGIVHSERTPEEMRGSPLAISGVQTWVALPERAENMAPEFSNHTVQQLPWLEEKEFRMRLMIGDMHGLKSDVPTYSETLYADVFIEAGGKFHLPAVQEERAIYILSGAVRIAGEVFTDNQLLAFRQGDDIVIEAVPQNFASEGAQIMVFGGEAMDSRRYIWWNFVSSSKERIEQAKEEWRSRRFDIVPGDAEEFIPLPE
ncbi:pirin family protein [Pseudochrobactrum algeriensis]|uniref:pirin family protein n=1 Tax=Pseudochrobactrum algeriensis TaxID=2834768 RepID=UPI001BCD7E7A|nr:pirin family protein [Pseudochrobactrum algeriensis]MBX8814086.1 pirin family protein [Ochrobactrum sp. MR34]QVQ37513.1 pirin family protein [Pseudochrobactrum algeriensis]QVQ40733.1 pirin family protein [Pseudochrobactrum algeriensis]QVQ44655.1 pirin family protein [Pseudochrobactrum algeriensis]